MSVNRYPNQQPGNAGYVNNQYNMPPGGGYYPQSSAGPGDFPPGYRDRYPPGSGQMDWNRSERDYGDYRRGDYDRRQPPANS